MGGGDSAPGGLALRGRRDERVALDGLIEGARAGQSGVLVDSDGGTEVLFGTARA